MATRCEDCNSYAAPGGETCKPCNSYQLVCVCLCCYERNYCDPYLLCNECSDEFDVTNILTPEELEHI